MPVKRMQLPELLHSSCGTVFRADVTGGVWAGGIGKRCYDLSDQVGRDRLGRLGLCPSSILHQRSHLLLSSRVAPWGRIAKKAVPQSGKGNVVRRLCPQWPRGAPMRKRSPLWVNHFLWYSVVSS